MRLVATITVVVTRDRERKCAENYNKLHNIFLLNCAISILVISNHNSFRVLFDTRSSAVAEGPRDASCQLKSCQLPRNRAETTYTTSPDQIDGMKLEI